MGLAMPMIGLVGKNSWACWLMFGCWRARFGPAASPRVRPISSRRSAAAASTSSSNEDGHRHGDDGSQGGGQAAPGVVVGDRAHRGVGHLRL